MRVMPCIRQGKSRIKREEDFLFKNTRLKVIPAPVTRGPGDKMRPVHTWVIIRYGILVTAYFPLVT